MNRSLISVAVLSLCLGLVACSDDSNSPVDSGKPSEGTSSGDGVKPGDGARVDGKKTTDDLDKTDSYLESDAGPSCEGLYTKAPGYTFCVMNESGDCQFFTKSDTATSCTQVCLDAAGATGKCKEALAAEGESYPQNCMPASDSALTCASTAKAKICVCTRF